MGFNRWAICEAYYTFAVLYHGGQFSKEYAYLGRLRNMGFKGGTDHPEKLDEESREVFDNLLSKNGFEPYTEDCL